MLYWGVPQPSEAQDSLHWDADRNCHISRQNLRSILLNSLDLSLVDVLWGTSIHSIEAGGTQLKVIRDGELFQIAARAVFACDGIF